MGMDWVKLQACAGGREYVYLRTFEVFGTRRSEAGQPGECSQLLHGTLSGRRKAQRGETRSPAVLGDIGYGCL